MNDRVEFFRSRRSLLRTMSFRSLHAAPERALQATAAEPARKRVGGWSWLRRWALPVLILLLLVSSSGHTFAQAGNSIMPFKVNLGVESASKPEDLDLGIRVLFTITLLSLAPSILLLMTCFTRIVIVLAFVRTALSLPGSPSNQIIIGLALFMTYYIMAPTWENIKRDAIDPYTNKQITGEVAMEKASMYIRTFMLKQTRPKDVELFVAMARMGPMTAEQLPLRVVVPGFIISELRTAFEMGFLLFVPFILIDLVVATVLMSMGMMMMPPMVISLPLKILLFVLVDGWSLIVRSLVTSFGM
jgi:flagellar biosynthesis protein FliP